MSFLDLDIQLSYTSFSDDKNIASSFLVPALKEAHLYQRSVGFFSSSVFMPIMDGIISIAKRHGTIQLIASPQLNQDDIQAISLGYEAREEIIQCAVTRDFLSSIDALEDMHLKLLATLISEGILDIRIATTKTNGIYHDKLGIMRDYDGNTLVFYGSANSSENAYVNNYEKIRVVKGWISAHKPSVDDECDEFVRLWNGNNPFVDVISYTEAAKKNVLETISKRTAAIQSAQSTPIVLRDYQEQAIKAWVENDYHGFFVMATGTGKTWTAIYAAKALTEKHNAMIVICAPYKHLVKQWADDVSKAYPAASIIMVSSENPSWEEKISQEIVGKRFYPNRQIIIISTITSFKMKRFEKTIQKSQEEKLLIVDEAHRFTDRSESIKQQYKYMLGLSATPFSGTSAQRGLDLMKFFGGQVFSLTIEDALARGYLVPYYYYPIFVEATDQEEQQFKSLSLRIASCFRNNICINPDLLVKTLRNRLRIISMAEEKQRKIDAIIEGIKEDDHVVVYCGDGRLFDSTTGEELRHIQAMKRKLTQYGYKASQFTARENMRDRVELVDLFNKGQITALAAIRCLDEGINIPSIRSALILSSNDDYREFVQRRGRILRTYTGKEYATIYDVIVLPATDLSNWAKIELRRFREYARLAKNWQTLEIQLDELLNNYGLCQDDVDVYDYEEMEGEIDE